MCHAQSYRTSGERLPPKKFNFELAARRKFFDGRLKTAPRAAKFL